MSRNRGQDGAPVSLFAFQDLITSLSGVLILIVLLLAVDVAVQKMPDSMASSTADIETAGSSLDRLRAEIDELKHYYLDLKEKLQNSIPQSAVDNVRIISDAEAMRSANFELSKIMQAIVDKNNELEERLATARLSYDELTAVVKDLQEKHAEKTTEINAEIIYFIPDERDEKTPVLIECSSDRVRVGYAGRNESPSMFTANKTGVDNFVKYLKKYSRSKEYFVFMIKPSGIQTFESFSFVVKKNEYDYGYDPLDENASIGFQKVN